MTITAAATAFLEYLRTQVPFLTFQMVYVLFLNIYMDLMVRAPPKKRRENIDYVPLNVSLKKLKHSLF